MYCILVRIIRRASLNREDLTSPRRGVALSDEEPPAPREASVGAGTRIREGLAADPPGVRQFLRDEAADVRCGRHRLLESCKSQRDVRRRGLRSASRAVRGGWTRGIKRVASSGYVSTSVSSRTAASWTLCALASRRKEYLFRE